ncbi:hypothetical protein FSP39_020928 [Pinctada imbricata]|uniref:Uncharacterized protein n=1 Tax=Pinctada imbricata TaxID=66713 RepID=A0AA89C461_PINIB|nr:hypothetical protein FSP39_020928 [Pinctada imbricata]
MPFHDDVDRDRVYDAIIHEIKVTHNQILIKQEPSSSNTELSSSAGSLPALQALMTENYVLGNDTPADPCRSPPKKKSAMEDMFGDVFVVIRSSLQFH